jgi:RNA-splicing ligase RtcB
MKLQTASETISFVKDLEEKSAKFYEDVFQRYSKDEDVLLAFAKENRKYFTQIQRAYYSVITDAIEEKILDFYHVAADQSMSLMADVPRNFKIVAKKRKNRIPTLKSLG